MTSTFLFLCFIQISFTICAGKPTESDSIKCPIQEGLIANPDQPCDHWFYHCHEFYGVRKPCPALQYFDSEMNKCDSWYNVPVCSGINRTMVSSTIVQGPVEANSYENTTFDCTKQAEGNHPFENAEVPYCSNLYFTCSIGVKYVNRCQPGYYYDRLRDWCETYENVVDCVNGKISSQTYDNYFDCTDKPDDIYANPHKNCSHHYYICADGTAYRITCRDKLYYNADLKLCDARENIFECTGGVRTEEPEPEGSQAVSNSTTATASETTVRALSSTVESTVESTDATVEPLHVMDEDTRETHSTITNARSTEITTMEPLHVMS